MPLAAGWPASRRCSTPSWTGGYGPIGRWVVSPHFHAFHHSVDRRHTNANFGIMFSCWDYLFGTAVTELERPARYGVDGIDFHESLASQFLTPFRLAWRWRHRGEDPRDHRYRPVVSAGPGMTRPTTELALVPLLRRSGSVIESDIRGSSMGTALPDGSRIRISCRSRRALPARDGDRIHNAGRAGGPPGGGGLPWAGRGGTPLHPG